VVRIRRVEEARNIGEERWNVSGLEQRVLFHTDELMVVWLKIPPGTEFPDHSHPHAQIGFQVSGRVELRGENGRFEIGPGTAYMFEPNELHGSRVVGGEPAVQLDAFHPAREDYLDADEVVKR